MNACCYDYNRIYTFYHTAKEILDGKMPRPRTALIYPSRVCDHHCYYCSDRWGNEKNGGFIPKDKLLGLPVQLKKLGVEGCELCGGGEPLLHPDIKEFIGLCVKQKIKLASLTNGTMLKGDLLRQVIENFSYCRVSIDTFDQEAYKKIRRPKSDNAQLKHVLCNIGEAVALKRKIGAPVQIGLKVCICGDNYKDVRKNVNKARELGIDSIQIKLARNSPQGELPAEVIEEVEGEIAWCKNNIKDMVVLGSVKMPRIDHQCWLAPCHIFIDTTGDARVCCYFQFREKDHTYGNVFKDGVEKVWFSKAHDDAIKKIKIQECNQWDCRYFIYNNTMKEAMINDHAQWQFV